LEEIYMPVTNHETEFPRSTEGLERRIAELEKNLDASRQEARRYRKDLDALSDRSHAQDSLAEIRYFENMDRINRAIQGTNDLEQMMNDVLEAMVSIFGCHRAWLGYPCAPEPTDLQVMLERTHPEYPGALQAGSRIPMDENSARLQRLLLKTGSPVSFGPGCDHPLIGKVPERFGQKSVLATALYPKVDQPWMLGMHQCDAPRIWTSDEKKLFQEIGRRLGDGLTSLLTIRNLHKSEAKVRSILENIGIGVAMVSPEMEIIEMNRRMRQWFPGVDLEKRPICYRTLNHPPREEICDYCPTAKTFQDGGVHEATTRTPHGGEIRNYHVVSSPVFDESGQVTAAIEVVKDITEVKEAEEKLRQSETRFRELFNNMGAGMAIYSSPDDGRNFEFLDLNKAGLALTGKTLSEVVSRRVRDVFPGIEEMGLFDTFRQVWKTGIPAKHPAGLYRDDKLERWFENYVYRLPSGELAAIFEDVTARKMAGEERDRLMAAIEHASEAIVITDTDGTIQYVNPSFEKITGYTSHEALGQNPRMLKSGVQQPALYEEMWAAISSGKTWTGRMVNKRKDGRTYTEEASISPILNGGSGSIVNYVAVKRDITRELEIENRLSQSQRIEAIGALAGGIAHDFNNILFPIIGLSDLLMDDLPAGSLERENAEGIHQAAQRAGELVKQILSFSRQTAQQKVPLRVQQVVKEVLKLTRSTIPSNIEIRSHIQQNCGMIMADPTQIHQIAMNLITNAYHAVEEKGGSISVQLKETDLPDSASSQNLLEPGEYAMLSVSDTGHGIAPSILHRIFEPYFSTKPQGKGTGLGLSVVYGIVKEHGGDIQVDSVPGSGTTFTVYLPLIEKYADTTPLETVPPLETGTERILMVDDEDAIIGLQTKILERLGYRITARTSSVDALKLFSENPAAFDAVITDMTMPNMTGDHLAREIIAIRPDIPIIICTGFSEKLSKERAESLGVRGFLMKPVVKSDLAEMVRKVLDDKTDK
jgi:PAS domain S-box-containing protein